MIRLPHPMAAAAPSASSSHVVPAQLAAGPKRVPVLAFAFAAALAGLLTATPAWAQATQATQLSLIHI